MVLVDIAPNLVAMTKYLSIFLTFYFSSATSADLLKLDCSRALNDDRGISFSLLIGTTKGIQVLKKGRLQMDLKQTDTHYELGQYTDAQKEGFIPVLKVNKETLNIDFAKYMQLDDPLECIKV